MLTRMRLGTVLVLPRGVLAVDRMATGALVTPVGSITMRGVSLSSVTVLTSMPVSPASMRPHTVIRAAPENVSTPTLAASIRPEA